MRPFHHTKKLTNWHVLGAYLGYPDCCIEEFVDAFELMLSTGLQKRLDENQSKIHKSNGFIPCAKCAKKVVLSGMEVEDLIKNRICLTPFPLIDVQP